MKINKLQINDFGKFSNKVIELDKSINIIKGENESGKSTIEKFIVSMFYGISGDRRKKGFTDFDKYFPWDKESFTGKISYTLDDGQSFEIYRDFTKKNPIIYNENAEDITKDYSKSKNKGSSAFEEQTGIDENTMLSSMVTEQSNVVIDQTSENHIIQKLANITETGDEKISYESAQKYLVTKRNEDVGTEKTKNKPINNLHEEKKKLTDEMKTLEEFNNEKYDLEFKIKELYNQEKETGRLFQLSTEYRKIVDNESKEYNKIEMYKEEINKNSNKINNLEENKASEKHRLEKIKNEYQETVNIKNEKIENLIKEHEKLNKSKKKANITAIIIAVFIFVMAVIMYFSTQSIAISAIILGASILVLIANAINNKNKNKKIQNNSEEIEKLKIQENIPELDEIEKKIREIEFEINVLTNQQRELKEKIEDTEEIIKNSEEEQLKKLTEQFEDITKDQFLEICDKKNIVERNESLQKLKNQLSVEIEKIEYRKKYIMPQLERYTEVEERLSDLDEREQEMMNEVNAISIASEVLEEAYNEMKKNVIPRFTENLSKTIQYISDGKYKKVVTNDKEGLLVEKENGEYITAKALSIGTIDQLYLSLRFAIIQESSSQIMPIILDEAFAYYDNNRLKNILKYITSEFKNHQIILFTCTEREKEILEEIQENFNMIEL